jgi:signal transduction histidine kinase
MLKRLRIQVTLLGVGVSMAFILLLGSGAYLLLRYHLQNSTDQALKVRLVLELQRLQAPVPVELINVQDEWLKQQSALLRPTVESTSETSQHESDEGAVEETSEHLGSFDSELAPIFVLPVDKQGQPLPESGLSTVPMIPDADALKAARLASYDLRTVTLKDGTLVRLITYTLSMGDSVAALQLGRPVTDQLRLMSQFLMGLALLGIASLLFLASASWFLAGRSLRPAQQAWEQQQAFVANASHELRAPLTLIRASADLAARKSPTADVRRLLEGITSEVDSMNHLVEDLLLLSRLDYRRLAVTLQPVALNELFMQLQQQAIQLTQDETFRFIANGGGLRVWADPSRLRQVLWILVDNAMHHARPGGRIQLEARQQHDQIRLAISDNGPGIDPRHLPHVFERFYKADPETPGSGLGLAIARALVEAMHGQISLTSKAGEGTRVMIILPAPTPLPFTE